MERSCSYQGFSGILASLEMPSAVSTCFLSLSLFGIVWTGVIFIESFMLLSDMSRKPALAVLCAFGAIAAFLKIMSCGFLIRTLQQCNPNECGIWLVVNIILSAVVEVLVLPIYFVKLPIYTFIIATTVSVAYSCGLMLCRYFFLSSLDVDCLMEVPETS